jgi:hypothetical protein
MPQNITQYSILFSCPGDITTEREIANKVVDEFTRLYSNTIGVSLLLRSWGADVFPESGGKPQDLINAQLVDKCDAAIAVFWTRFGCPTDKYGSGTEEEIERMLHSRKQVFLYFSDKPLKPSEQDTEGYKKIQEFRKKYSNKGIYWTFSTDDQFKDLLFVHLTNYFLGKTQLDAYKNKDRSDLRLLGIDEKGNLTKNASSYQFVLNNMQSKKEYKKQIVRLFHEISEMNVGKREEPQYKPKSALELLSGSGSTFSDPVSIKEDDRKKIEKVLKVFGFSIPEGFFDLGNLSQNTLLRSVYSNDSLIGTETEKDKYYKIDELLDTISEAIEWAPIEDAFRDKNCIRLALQNCGKAIDEDIELTMAFPSDAIESIYDIAQFDNDRMEYLLRKQDIDDLFGIKSTADYLDYSASKPDQSGPNPIPTPIPMYNYIPDYSNAFYGELRDIFCYSIYSKGNQSVVKIKFNYIKHNTVVAFPSAIFLKNKVSSIPYKITSKNNPDVIEGMLNVE